MTHWWRAYDDAIDNPKLLKLSDADHRAWFTLQCIASANGGSLPPAVDIAVRLRLKPARVAGWITKLVQAKLIDNNEGVFSPHNWDTRQYKSDVTDPTAPQRMKRYREKKRNDRNADERNDRNGSVTEIRSEAEADSEANQSRAEAAPPIVDEGLKKRAFALSTNVALQFTSRGMPLPPADRSVHWLQQGFNPQAVLAAVEKVLKRGKPISTMEYFDGAIRDEHAKPPMPISGTAEVVDLSRINWDATVKLWRGNQSIWPRGIGSEPGQPGCKCPANIIAANGIDPGNGRSVSYPLVFISQGSQEMLAHCTEAQITGGRHPKVFEFEEDGILKTGAYVSQAFPDNWDSATGERIPPANSEVDAA